MKLKEEHQPRRLASSAAVSPSFVSSFLGFEANAGLVGAMDERGWIFSFERAVTGTLGRAPAEGCFDVFAADFRVLVMLK